MDLCRHKTEHFVPETTLPFLERPPRKQTNGAEHENSPLLILLHGRAAEAKTIFSIEGLLDPRFHVLALQACYVSEKGGFEWFKPNESGPSEEIPENERFDEAEQMLTRDITSHITRLHAASSPLFFWGFSQGAAMSLILGLRGILKPRGVVPMGGFLPSPVKQWGKWDTSAGYLFVHGTNDEVLPPESSLKAKAFLDSIGAHTEYFEYRGRHKMTLDSIAHINTWLQLQSGLEANNERA